MSYGYIGETPSQVKKNAGVLSVSDVLDLTEKKHISGSLEHINTIDLNGDNYATFTLPAEYDQHIFFFKSLVMSANDTFRAVLSDDGGSTYKNSAYESTVVRQNSNSTKTDLRRNNYSLIDRIIQNIANIEYHGKFILNNASNSSRFTQYIWQTTSYDTSLQHGSYHALGALRDSSVIDTIKFYLSVYNLTGSIEMYGFKK